MCARILRERVGLTLRNGGNERKRYMRVDVCVCDENGMHETGVKEDVRRAGLVIREEEKAALFPSSATLIR